MECCHSQACVVFKAFFSHPKSKFEKEKNKKLQTFGEPFQTITQSALS